MPNKLTFFTTFATSGFILKIFSEFLHEVCGHGFFVLLFGGKITGLHISLLWPYELSRISWSFLGDVSPARLAWIYGGGILVCLLASFVAQAFLFLRKKVRWHFAVVIFWLAFWTLVNSTGYLMIGGLAPFRDVEELIGLGVLTRQLSLFMGFFFFALGFLGLSWILRKAFMEIYPSKKASICVSLFWLIIPVLVFVMIFNPERGLAWSYLPLSFIPALLSIVIEYFLFLSK